MNRNGARCGIISPLFMEWRCDGTTVAAMQQHCWRRRDNFPGTALPVEIILLVETVEYSDNGLGILLTGQEQGEMRENESGRETGRGKERERERAKERSEGTFVPCLALICESPCCNSKAVDGAGFGPQASRHVIYSRDTVLVNRTNGSHPRETRRSTDTDGMRDV